MRVLTVVYDLDIGGTQRAAATFANAYSDLGHASAVLATHALGTRRGDLRKDVEVFPPGTDEGAAGAWEPDVVHVHGHGLDRDSLRRLHRTPAGQARWVEQNVFAQVNPWADLLDGTFLFSLWCEHQYAERPGPHLPVARVPNPIDESAFFRDLHAGASVREELGIPAEALVLGRIGQPQPYKWSTVLVDAFEEWARTEPRAWLLLIGAPQVIRDRVNGSAVRERVRVVDRVVGDDALRAHYNAMDIFGHVARQGETFGYVLTEAALCEIPVVTLSTPWADNSQGEVVGHGSGGLVATTAEGFTHAVRRLGADAEERQRLGVGGRQRPLARYSATVVARTAIEATDTLGTLVPPPPGELLSLYSNAVDPPGAVRRSAFLGERWNTLAWLSGAESASWLARTTLNRWGISRHGFHRPSTGAT